jgi:hypothetical protein
MGYQPDEDKHPCLKWDCDMRYQYSRGEDPRQDCAAAVIDNIIADSFSRVALVKTNQTKAMQHSRECGVGRLYSCASRPLSVGSLGTEPNSQVLPSVSYSPMRCFRPVSQWLNVKT